MCRKNKTPDDSFVGKNSLNNGLNGNSGLIYSQGDGNITNSNASNNSLPVTGEFEMPLFIPATI